jgi:hypothetical protein
MSLEVKRRPAEGRTICPRCNKSFNVRGYGMHAKKCITLQEGLPLPLIANETCSGGGDGTLVSNSPPTFDTDTMPILKMARNALRPHLRTTIKHIVPKTPVAKLRTVSARNIHSPFIVRESKGLPVQFTNPGTFRLYIILIAKRASR